VWYSGLVETVERVTEISDVQKKSYGNVGRSKRVTEISGIQKRVNKPFYYMFILFSLFIVFILKYV
jgi:hypothetical protein